MLVVRFVACRIMKRNSSHSVVNDTINDSFEMNKLKSGTAQQCRHTKNGAFHSRVCVIVFLILSVMSVCVQVRLQRTCHRLVIQVYQASSSSQCWCHRQVLQQAVTVVLLQHSCHHRFMMPMTQCWPLKFDRHRGVGTCCMAVVACH